VMPGMVIAVTFKPVDFTRKRRTDIDRDWARFAKILPGKTGDRSALQKKIHVRQESETG
jgi:hypothetical protein